MSRCWAEIDTRALRHNAQAARSRVGDDVELMAVVKANAYGHGLPDVVRALANDADLFGVANVDEAKAVREISPAPVVILGPALPEERAEIARSGFIPSVSSADEADAFAALAAAGSAVQVSLVVDTGMGRMGCAEGDAVDVAGRIGCMHGVAIHSISTHLPVADEDAEFTRTELSRFRALIDAIRQIAGKRVKAHALLSAGILGFNESPFDIVRAGLILYGISPLPDFQGLLQPAMTLKSRVALVRDLPAGSTVSYGRTFTASSALRVATVGAGYADGYPRALSGAGASVLVRGMRCAVLGRVTMDMTIVDVSKLPAVRPGDEVVLIGRQGSEEILASELAEKARTIPWDIFTGIGMRVRRVYL